MYPFELHSAAALNNRLYVTSPIRIGWHARLVRLGGALASVAVQGSTRFIRAMTFLSLVRASTVLANSCHILNMGFRVGGRWYFTYQLAVLATEPPPPSPSHVEATFTTYPHWC
jgi:hypothetical protein